LKTLNKPANFLRLDLQHIPHDEDIEHGNKGLLCEISNKLKYDSLDMIYLKLNQI